MARRVFFAFHYERDMLRVAQIRNGGVVLGPGDTPCGLVDSVEWDIIRMGGDGAILRWIDGQLRGTSVTVVLIGAETANRQWINYEIVESVRRGNGLLGVYIHNVRDASGSTAAKGDNPFDYVTWRNTGAKLSAAAITAAVADAARKGSEATEEGMRESTPLCFRPRCTR